MLCAGKAGEKRCQKWNGIFSEKISPKPENIRIMKEITICWIYESKSRRNPTSNLLSSIMHSMKYPISDFCVQSKIRNKKWRISHLDSMSVCCIIEVYFLIFAWWCLFRLKHKAVFVHFDSLRLDGAAKWLNAIITPKHRHRCPIETQGFHVRDCFAKNIHNRLWVHLLADMIMSKCQFDTLLLPWGYIFSDIMCHFRWVHLLDKSCQSVNLTLGCALAGGIVCRIHGNDKYPTRLDILSTLTFSFEGLHFG